jgi:hypothetical protein
MIKREIVNAADALWARDEARLQELIPGLSSALVGRFTQSHEATTVAVETARAIGATTIGQIDLDELASRITGANDFWNALFGAYPSASALVELSRVAFNESMTEALVYCGYHVSPIGGEGSIIFLRRAESVWVAARWLQVWIS